MEGKRRSGFWTAIVSIYLTIVTAGCAVFGYLYFTTRFGQEDGKLTIASAKMLVNTVCYDLGLISEAEYKNATSSKELEIANSMFGEGFGTAADALTEQTYSGSKVDLSPMESVQQNITGGVNTALLLSKFLLEENFSASKKYKSSAQAGSGMDRTVEYEIADDTLTFSQYNYFSQQSKPNSISRVEVQKTGNGWKLTYNMVGNFSGDEKFYVYHFGYQGEDGVGLTSAFFNAFVLDGFTTPPATVTNEKIVLGAVYKCDTKNHAKMAYYKDETQQAKAGFEQMSDEDLLSEAKKALNNTSSLNYSVFDDYSSWVVDSRDFLTEYDAWFQNLKK